MPPDADSAISRPRPQELGCYFLLLGTYGFGGPIALAARMHKDLVSERAWVSEQEYRDGLAFAQLSPGPLAAQLAMYLGMVCAGVRGATVAALTFILPSYLMVVALAAAYQRFGGLAWMQALFYGIGAAVTAIIARSAAKLAASTLQKDRLLWAIAVVLAVSTAVTRREIVGLFLAGGVVCAIVRAVSVQDLRVPAARLCLAASPAAMLSAKSFQIFIFFAKAGLFVFGSGLAIVPFLHGGVVEQLHWLDERQFLDAIAVAMITPGPVVITVAFIGYLVDGLRGSLAAAAGVFLPVYLMVLWLAPHYRRLSSHPQLRAFITGVTAAAVGAIFGAAYVIASGTIRDVATVGVAVASLLLLIRWRLPEPLLILGASLCGLALKL